MQQQMETAPMSPPIHQNQSAPMAIAGAGQTQSREQIAALQQQVEQQRMEMEAQVLVNK